MYNMPDKMLMEKKISGCAPAKKCSEVPIELDFEKLSINDKETSDWLQPTTFSEIMENRYSVKVEVKYDMTKYCTQTEKIKIDGMTI